MTDKGIIFSKTEDRKAKQKAWRQRERAAINARTRCRYAANIEIERRRQREYRKRNAESVKAYNRVWLIGYRARLKAEMIVAYGGRCQCCGEAEPMFLQLDHIHNDGHIDRRVNKTSAKLWAALKRSGWPKGRHQLLCANCNFGKLMNNGVCPHVG